MAETELTQISLTEGLNAARAKLTVPTLREASSMKALGAAALAAFSALTLAAAVIMGPGVEAHPTHVSAR
jgi:hypothetical protein